MSTASRFLLPVLLAAALPATARAQAPTLPSDTLQANFAPRSAPGPMPEVAPSLPSDTLRPGELILPADTLTDRRWWRDEVPREGSVEQRVG